MSERLPSRTYALSFLAVFVLAAVVHLPSALAQDYAGTWRVTRDEVAVSVAEWGTSCGPRPTSRQGSVGRQVSIRNEGSHLVFSGGRTNRTDRCWSDNPGVAVQSASHPSPDRWVVTCATPESAALGERGQYTLGASGPDRLHFRDETRYSWVIEGSNCRATAVLQRDYERVATPAVAPTPDVPRPAPPVARCASPGSATSLQITPARRSTVAGGRACFRARGLDANRCEVAATGVVWTMRRTAGAAEGGLEEACFVAAPGSGEGELEITAAMGALSARAVAAVVSQDRYRSLVAARLEDTDAGTTAPATTGTTSGSQVGGTTVEPAQGTSRGPSLAFWLLLAAAAVLGLGGTALLLVRRRPATGRASSPVVDQLPVAASPSLPPAVTTTGRQRREAVPLAMRQTPSGAPPRQAAPAAKAEAEAVVPAASAATPAVRDPSLRCPQCSARYADEMAFCPVDGTALVPLVAGAPPATAAPPRATGAMRCTRCGTVVVDGSRFCPHDGDALVPGGDAVATREPDGVCPVCHRRYPPPTTFCGEDGAALVRSP